MSSLSHYGVLGMKWGRRRGLSSSSTSSSDHIKTASLKKKKLNEMSNQEIKDLTTRLQLERQYADLNKLSVASGRKIVGDILMNTGKQTAANYTAKAVSKIIETALKKGQ